MTVHVDRSLRLPEGEYFPEPQRKTGIAIHHTVCRSARTTVELWRTDKATDGRESHVATAFVIERDHAAVELFEDSSGGVRQAAADGVCGSAGIRGMNRTGLSYVHRRRSCPLGRASSCALIATTMVDTDMSAAPMAGVSRTPKP